MSEFESVLGQRRPMPCNSAILSERDLSIYTISNSCCVEHSSRVAMLCWKMLDRVDTSYTSFSSTPGGDAGILERLGPAALP